MAGSAAGSTADPTFEVNSWLPLAETTFSECIATKFQLNYVGGRIGDQNDSRKAEKVKLRCPVSDHQSPCTQSYKGDTFRFFRITSKFLAYGVGQ